ncbi:AraC family transcriptional regulator [Paenibacillus sp. ACRRX]|uniref:helix-turn-helix transcriptional regulator n=1 Tax=Paenibacillus sp. ACRRX TaxID=2918206 RepID=UPI001EF3EB50|nr:AraC family transcriptional regulator [Paenibacillus sp. ACRRX]MCG7410731.1 AraC family transcriptional regulator [Paenibacillus sp. ACRRX]
MWLEHKRWVEDAILYIEHHLKEDVDFEDIAKHTAVSRYHLHRVFQGHVGVSAASYLRERRLSEAAIDLLYTDKRILDISLEYRFAGQDSFTRSFKQYYGFTPQQYRKGFRSFQRMEEEQAMDQSIPQEAHQHTNLSVPPVGWMLTGVYPHQYTVGIDRKIVNRGTASGTIRAAESAHVQGFGTLMQMFKADLYRGKRLRLTGFLKSAEVHMAGLWLRIDGKDEEPLAFDNMMNRAVRGTTEWTSYEVVLDVAENAHAVAFGVLLSGPGQVWVDSIRLEEVDMSVPTTDTMDEDKTLPASPSNLDFEDDTLVDLGD